MALLGDLQRVYENTYAREAGVDLEACVVGPRRCAELVAASGERSDEMSDLARFFYYVEDANLRLALFYADETIEALERRDPRRTISEANVVPFLVFAEECSHALHTTLAFHDGGAKRVSGERFPAELEILARIDAYLLLAHFVAGLAERFTARERAWVRHQAVDRWDVSYADAGLADRYAGAARRAGVFVDHLDGLAPAERLAELRRFRALSLTAKARRIEWLGGATSTGAARRAGRRS